MAFDHNFSVGQPDNLVYINELLDLLEGKLDNLVSVGSKYARILVYIDRVRLNHQT